MFIQWSDEKHSLGLPGIDNQHKELFLITNQIYETSSSTDRMKELNDLFKRLYAYTKYHFSSEEGLFKHYGYPDALEHKKRHAGFTESIKEKAEWYRSNPQRPIDELLDFLVEWIVNHILGDDRRYRDYFKKQGIEIRIHYSSDKSGQKAMDLAAQTLWKEQKLEMEIASIDNQHKELVFILQQFNDLQKASLERRWAFTPHLIQKLFYYSQYHFSHEEELMSKSGYSETLEHRELHQDFIMKIQDFSREYKLGKETLHDEIIHFLKDWILTHILEEDAKYKELLQDQLKD